MLYLYYTTAIYSHSH